MDVLPTPPLPVKRITRTPVSLRARGARLLGLVDVVLDQYLNVPEDRERDLGVLLDRLEDLDVLLIGLVGLVGGVFEGETVFLGLAVAGEQQHGACVGGLD